MEGPMVVAVGIGRALSLRVVEEIERLLASGMISRRALRDYHAMAKENLHSWLQYALIRAAEHLGLLAAPEVKVPFREPLDPGEILPGKNGRKRWMKKVDVGFFMLPKKFIGFGECYTLDEFHACLPTRELLELFNETAGYRAYGIERMWINPRDTVMHLVDYAEAGWRPSIAVLLVVLPEREDRVRSRDQRLLISRGSGFFLKRWMKMVDEMRGRGVDAHLVRIGEAGIWVDGELVVDLSSGGLEDRVERWRELVSSSKIKPFTEESEPGWKWMSREYAEKKLGLR